MQKIGVCLTNKVNAWAWALDVGINQNNESNSVYLIDFCCPEWNPRFSFQLEQAVTHGISTFNVKSLVARQDSDSFQEIKNALFECILTSTNVFHPTFRGIPIGSILKVYFSREMGTEPYEVQQLEKQDFLNFVEMISMGIWAFDNFFYFCDSVIISNGRDPIEATLLHLSRESGIPTTVLEKGARISQVQPFRNSPHFVPDWWDLLQDASKLIGTIQARDLIEKYWQTRFMGLDTVAHKDWSIFMRKGFLPQQLTKQNYVLFLCSSQHEFAALPNLNFQATLFEDQIAAAQSVVEQCRRRNLQVVIKRHPNSLSKHGIDVEESIWSSVRDNNHVVYLSPFERVDYFLLIEKAKCVLTYRSSGGIEAAKMKVPCRAMGAAEWAFHRSALIQNEEELQNFLDNPSTLEVDYADTWAYFSQTFGQSLSIFDEVISGYAKKSSNYFFACHHYSLPLSIRWYRQTKSHFQRLLSNRRLHSLQKKA